MASASLKECDDNAGRASVIDTSPEFFMGARSEEVSIEEHA